MDLPLEKLAERYQTVPTEIRLALSSREFSEKIFAIGEEHGLLLDQSDALSEIVALVMLGVTPRAQFHDKVAALGVSDEAVSAITRDINEKVFEPLRASFREMEDENSTREDILNEIENPSPAYVRIEPVRTAPSLAETHNSKVLGSERPEAPIEPKREEPAALPPVIDPSHELAAPAASMPAPEPVTIPAPPVAAPKPVPPPPQPAAPITEAPRRVTEIRPETQPPARRSVDPYREPIE